MDEITKFIIERTVDGFTSEEIAYLLNKRMDIDYTPEQVEILQEKYADEIKVEESIREKAISKSVDDLSFRLEKLYLEAEKMFEEMRKENRSKTAIMVLTQIHNILQTMLKLLGELKENVNINIQKNYISIVQIRQYIRDNILEIVKTLDDKKKKEIVKVLAE